MLDLNIGPLLQNLGIPSSILTAVPNTFSLCAIFKDLCMYVLEMQSLERKRFQVTEQWERRRILRMLVQFQTEHCFCFVFVCFLPGLGQG